MYANGPVDIVVQYYVQLTSLSGAWVQEVSLFY